MADVEHLNIPPAGADSEGLRQQWDEGRASGRAGPLEIQRLIAEERAALEKAGRERP